MKTVTLDPDRQLYSVAYLSAALEMEQMKINNIPVTPDCAPGYKDAKAWGYVVAGYFLLEQAIKFLISVRGDPFPGSHSLSRLFDMLSKCDRKVLCEYYCDFYFAGENARHFPISKLPAFLVELDTVENSDSGSLAWRYFLIQKPQVDILPAFSAEFLHEIVYGAIKIAEIVITPSDNNPCQFTYSQRERDRCLKAYMQNLHDRMNNDGGKDLGDRLEIFWGPDSLGRYDYMRFEGKKAERFFEKYPKNCNLPIWDMRAGET